jgi:endonuclease YncB( thermonuclease family)
VQPRTLAVTVGCFTFAIFTHATAGDSFTGKVVKVADGNTITVLRGKTQVRVRLYGIDTPEKAQPFGNKAKQFTSKLVFGKKVKVEVVTIGKYGRTVARVHYNMKIKVVATGATTVRHFDLGEALVAAGLAWWYRKYAPNDKGLAKLGAEAQKAKRGLWVEQNPVAPWAWRKGKRRSSNSKREQRVKELIKQAEAALKAGNFTHAIKIGPRALKLSPNHPAMLLAMGTAACNLKDRATAQRAYDRLNRPERDQIKAICASKGVAIDLLFHGNVKSKVFHAPGCRHYRCKNCTVVLKSPGEAVRAGYRPHKQCVGSASAAPRPAPVAQPQPPNLPWSKDHVCKRDSDCVFAHSPCPLCPPCKPTWRAVTSRAEYRRREDFYARRRIRCIRCKPCPDGPSKWLGTKAVCVKGQCTMAGR